MQNYKQVVLNYLITILQNINSSCINYRILGRMKSSLKNQPLESIFFINAFNQASDDQFRFLFTVLRNSFSQKAFIKNGGKIYLRWSHSAVTRNEFIDWRIILPFQRVQLIFSILFPLSTFFGCLAIFQRSIVHKIICITYSVIFSVYILPYNLHPMCDVRCNHFKSSLNRGLKSNEITKLCKKCRRRS